MTDAQDAQGGTSLISSWSFCFLSSPSKASQKKRIHTRNSSLKEKKGNEFYFFFFFFLGSEFVTRVSCAQRGLLSKATLNARCLSGETGLCVDARVLVQRGTRFEINHCLWTGSRSERKLGALESAFSLVVALVGVSRRRVERGM